MRIIGENLIVSTRPIEQSTEGSATNFTSTRFCVFSATHNSSILIGSSLTHPQHSVAQEQVLDAAAMADVMDENGVVIGIKQATADGLGGSVDDPHENTSIAIVASQACQTFIDNDRPPHKIYAEIATTSHNWALPVSKTQKYDSSCAMAAAKFTYLDGTYQGDLSNLGDTTILLLDKDFRVKSILAAQQVYRGFGTWTPPSVQMLNDQRYSDCLMSSKLQADEGDLVISMTDGVWSELQPLLKKAGTRRTFQIDPHILEDILAPCLKKYLPAHILCTEILNSAITASLGKRRELNSLVSELRALPLESQNLSVQEVLSILMETGKMETATILSDLLFLGEERGDGIVYKKDVAIPFSLVIDDLQRRTTGDCSTINISRLPYHLDELIRAFIMYPSRQQTIMNELKAHLNSVEAIAESFARLRQETVPIAPQLLLGEMTTKNVFNPKILYAVEYLLVRVYHIYHIVRTEKTYTKTIVSVRDYMETIEAPMRPYVYNLIKDFLSPPPPTLPERLFSREVPAKLFAAFSEQYGPGCDFSSTAGQEDLQTAEGPG